MRLMSNGMKKALVVFGSVIICALLAVTVYFIPILRGECYKVPDYLKPIAGSQGYRIWSGDILKSFDHKNRPVCVPQGWEAVGAIETGAGWAKFETNLTGVLIRSDAFTLQSIQPKHSIYRVDILYPVTTTESSIQRYVAIIENAFNRTGKLFNDAPKEQRVPHVVLITAGLAGNADEDATHVYPDPSARVSAFVRTSDSLRGEELFIHAVMHLYNRHQNGALPYQKLQSPFTEEDWQEVEATWAETAFTTSAEQSGRIVYLYGVHTALRTGNFSLIKEAPFNNQKAFEKIRQSVIVAPGSPNLDYQYGHYVLAPLSMLAVDGMLQESRAGTGVEKILTDIHAGKASNFFDELQKTLSKEDVQRARGWFEGRETIPTSVINLVVASYKSQ
ncbi:MAG: hypothetical protein Greene07147_629 [Parcubacteria group bacterium Greene0714_7]|nr:MAG: hypothetical protein Greene07147_629 [Parcubacteria group bacterium Greene0714_7]